MSDRHHYIIFGLTTEQLELISEGLRMSRLYQQGFVDVDGRAKLTAIKRLEGRIERRLDKWRQRETR